MPKVEKRISYPEKKKILFLKSVLILSLFAVLGYAACMAVFSPTEEELRPVNIAMLPEGEWKLLLPFETFIAGPKEFNTDVIKDSSGQKFIRLKTVNLSGTYSGAIFHIKQPVPKNTSLAVEWRGSGKAPMVLVDVMDGSRTQDDIKGDLGENFYQTYPLPAKEWSTIKAPLSTLLLNAYQVAGKKIDGTFDYNKIRRVSLTFYPGTDAVLDIRDIRFAWKTEKWAIASILFLISLPGFLLFFRTRNNYLFLQGGTSLRTNILISRIVFCLTGISAVAASFFQGPDFLSIPTLAVFAALLLLVLAEEFTAVFQHNPLWSMRYAAILISGYYLGFSGGIVSLSFILLSAYVPVILERIRLLFWVVALSILTGYIAFPVEDAHFPFLTGLILIFCCSAAAVIVKEFLQQQHADFMAEKAILQYEALFKKTSDAIYVLDENGIIETVNQGFERLTGYSISELKGHSISSFVCAESKKTIDEMLLSIALNDTSQYDIYFLHKDGGVRAALVRGSAIYRNKQLTGFQALATDITERKNAEKQLKELNANKDKFFSIISHDLRNPFSSLLGFTDLIVKEYDTLSDEEIKKFAANINISVKNLYKLLDNLLQWATIQSGKMEYLPGAVQLHAHVDCVIGILTGNAANKNISLFNNTQQGILVYADSNSITSVLQNLVMNAIKFTSSGGTVEITSGRADKNIEITVSDTGIGMTEDEIRKIFRIDVQHSTKGTAEESGTGLGLILCKEMVEKNGGTIRVESQPGKGSRFTFTLPEFIPLEEASIVRRHVSGVGETIR